MNDTTISSKLRNARACEACRASKSRCVYKSNVGRCQRCEGNGTQCIVRSKARPMRARALRSGNTLAKNLSPNATESTFTLELPAISVPDSSKTVAALHQHHKEFLDEDGLQEEAGQIQSSGGPSVVERRLLTLGHAQKLLSTFLKMSSSFPFVVIPADATIPSLARTSPFLLLAILTTASIQEPPLYHQMDNEFRRVLSAKVIMEGKRSVDFLQGLLVYIAWYPIHVNPKSNQSFMYINLAISLVVDLGLDHETPNLSNFNEISKKDLLDGASFTDTAKRAYLGCYYLSSSLSQGFQKPNNLPYRDFMVTHSGSSMRDQYSSEIHSLIQLRRLAERIADLYESRKPTSDVQTEALNAEINIQMFLNELQAWRLTTDDSIKVLPFVGLAERLVAMTIYSHELGFLRRPYRHTFESPSNPGGPNTSHLLKCLEASKKFFEYLLSLPETSFFQFTVAQWSSIVLATLILSRLTFLMAATLGWDSDMTRSSVPLVMYLDCLCYRFQSMTSFMSSNSDSAKYHDVLYVSKMIFESVKKSYERRVAKIEPDSFSVKFGNATGVARGQCPIHDPSLQMFFDVADSTYGDSFNLNDSDAQSVATSSTAPLYHDLWATMTGNWIDNIY